MPQLSGFSMTTVQCATKGTCWYAVFSSTGYSGCSGPRVNRGIPWVKISMGGSNPPESLSVYKPSRRALNSLVDAVVAVSSVVAELSRIAFKQPVPGVSSFNQIDLAELTTERTRPSFCPAGDYILFVGSLDEHKGIDVLLEAHALLENQIPLVVIGTEPGVGCSPAIAQSSPPMSPTIR